MVAAFPRKTIFIAVLLIVSIIAVLGLIPIKQQSQPSLDEIATVTVGNVQYNVRVADTPAQRTKGLQGVSELADNEGMLFAFDEEGQYDFWNKDTLLELDLIYINNGKIVERGFLPAYDPNLEPAIYYPSAQAQYVLEVKKGEIPKHKFKVGDPVTIK